MDEHEQFPEEPARLPDQPVQPAPTFVPTPRKKSNIKIVLLIIIGSVLVAGLAFGAVKLLANSKPKTTPTQPTQETSLKAQTDTSISDIPAAGELKTFKSDHPRVEFKYPTTWSVKETTDLGVRVESPEFTYERTDSTPAKGNFRIYIRQGARSSDSKYIGRGVAIEPSEKLTYTEPAVGQRADTNLTLFGLDAPNNFAYFFIAGNYALKKDDTLGPGYGKETETYIIAGGFSSTELTDDLATNKVPLTGSFKQSNAYKQAIDIVKSLKLL